MYQSVRCDVCYGMILSTYIPVMKTCGILRYQSAVYYDAASLTGMKTLQRYRPYCIV